MPQFGGAMEIFDSGCAGLLAVVFVAKSGYKKTSRPD
jgi:hypothetical protein